jgi:hypothetical protein
VSQLESRVEDLRGKVSYHRQAIANLQSERSRLEERSETLQRRLRSLSAEKERLTRDYELAQRESERRDRDYQDAERAYNIASSDYQRAEERVNEVSYNIELARSEVAAVGANHGTIDGAREGTEEGEREGTAEGQSVGRKEGERDGREAGQKAWYDQGFALGKEDGTALGREEALADAERQGKIDGTALGTQKGLEFAYNTGFKRGEETANDPTAIEEGYKKGFKAGHARAMDHAKPEEAKGFLDKELEYRSKPLTPVELGRAQEFLANNFDGLQESLSTKSDGRYYNPRPDNYPHPRIKPFYLDAYDKAYRTNLSSAYDTAFNSAYEKAYNDFYQREWEKHSQLEYPESYQEGYSVGKERFRKSTYESTYPGEYASRKQYYFDLAFAANKDDEAKTAEGFKAGNRKASLAKGYTKGDSEGYSQNLTKEKQLAYQRGVKAADKKFTNNAVLEVVSISLTDSSSDGFFVPGEAGLFKVVLKNFGLKATTDVAVRLEERGEILDIDQPLQALPLLPGQSLITVNSTGDFKLKEGLSEGATTTLSLQIEEKSEPLQSQEFKIDVEFPLALTDLKVPEFLITEKENTVSLAVKNNSKVTAAIDILMSVDGEAIELTNPTQNLELKAGEQKSLEFSLKGKRKSLFTRTPISVTGKANGLNQFIAKESSTVIAQAHTTTPDSVGLLIGSDLSEKNVNRLFETLRIDTWDLRVDGSKLGEKLLKSYLNRGIYLFVDKAILASGLLYELTEHSKRGGTVVLLGQLQALSRDSLSLFGISDLKETMVKGVAGAHFLEGLADPISANGFQLELDRKADAILFTSGAERVFGSVTQLNPLTDTPGHLAVIAVEAALLTEPFLKNLADRVLNRSKDFATKTQLAEKDIRAMSGLVRDIAFEIKGDDLDKSVRWLKKKKKKSKLLRSIKKFLVKNLPEHRREMAKLYPLVLGETLRMEDSTDQRSALYLIDNKSVNRKSWRGHYCDLFRDEDTTGICK